MSSPSHSPAEILHQVLLDDGLIQTDAAAAWFAFVNYWRDDVDRSVLVSDTQGVKIGRLMRGGALLERHGVQITTRATAHTPAYERIQAITEALDSKDKTIVQIDTTSSFDLDNVSRQGSIMNLGIDHESPRKWRMFSVNYLLTIREN